MSKITALDESSWEQFGIVRATFGLAEKDVDVDIESGAKCMTIRVHGSPDASPERTKTYNEAWDDGPRQRGALCRRLKRAYRLMVPDAGETQTAPEPTEEEQS